MEVMFTKECSNFGYVRLQTGQKMVHDISRISRNFSREMGRFFSHLARNQKCEKRACLVPMISVVIQNQTVPFKKFLPK